MHRSNLVALTFQMLCSAAVATASKPPPTWRITRTDYVEFCAGNSTTFDLARGKIAVSLGACDPNRGAVPTRIERAMPPHLLASLRAATSYSPLNSFMDAECERRSRQRAVVALSGPISLNVRNRDQVISLEPREDCVTPAAQQLWRAVDDAIVALHIPRLR